MTMLRDIRANIFYAKDDSGELQRVNEIVFITEQKKYELSNSNQVIRSNELKSHRIVIENKRIDSIIEFLEKIKNTKEEDLE